VAHGAIRLLGLGLSLTAAVSCAGYHGDLNPLYVGHVDESSSFADSFSLGPFFDDAEGPGYEETAVHPLWRSVTTPERHEVQILDPLFNYSRHDDRSSFRFLSLGWFNRYYPEPEEKEWDLRLFPLLFAGGGPPGDNYFALIPLGGTIRDFAGFREALIVLFPLYYRLTKDVDEEENFHNITPFIGWTSGGAKDGSFRFLPIYGQWLWEGQYERYSYLWPFLHYQKNRLNTSTPSTLFAFWPFFKIDRSERHRFLTLLWPFFRFNEATEIDRDTGEEEEYYRYDFLWPLYRREKTRDFERTRLFPFFSRYRSEDLDSDAFAIPFLWRREARTEEWTKKTFDLVPLLHRQVQKYHDGRPDNWEWRLWPFFASGEFHGTRAVRVPILIPLGDNRFTSDFRANWSPLVTLYHDVQKPNGDRRITALLRLFEYRRTAQRTSWTIPVVYAGESTEDRTTHDLLWGLVRFGHGKGGWSLRLFHIPLLQAEETAP
jgi:hypothetical protein